MKPIRTTENSILLVDKPVGFSSFQIVRMLQKTTRKVGHGGTLDPFASGLLIILFNRATKLAGASGTKGSMDPAVADELLAAIDEIAEIFAETKQA